MLEPAGQIQLQVLHRAEGDVAVKAVVVAAIGAGVGGGEGRIGLQADPDQALRVARLDLEGLVPVLGAQGQAQRL